MADTLILVHDVRKGVYSFPENFSVQPDDMFETTETLINPKTEKAILIVKGKEHKVTIHTEKIGKYTFPYVTVSEIGGILP